VGAGVSVYELLPNFRRLFSGLDTAFGTGRGQWIKRPPRPEDWIDHLEGKGPGIGIAPLRQDSTVKFAAIDLDEPDFDAAREMQKYIPGTSWIERSRSGNAHVWVFFSEPVEAWVPMGILKEATLAAGKTHVEVFPKNHDFTKVKLGNYINLPFHGNERPILHFDEDGDDFPYDPELFIADAEASLNEPSKWRDKARWLMIDPPSERERRAEFGTQPNLHMCAEYIIEHAEDNPITPGHRSATYFALAKQLTNWSQVDHEETLAIMRSVNEAAGTDSIPDSELRRILGNAERGQFTSTGCDDPLVTPFCHPECPIAYPRR
jgi:hypothetical protein